MSISQADLSLSDAVTRYLNDCGARGESRRTLEGKGSNLRAFERWCHGHCFQNCSDINQPELEWYRSHISQYVDARRKKRLDIATQRNRLTAVKVFFTRLHFLHCIPRNPAAFFELPTAPHRIPKSVLTEEEVERILEHTMLYGDRGIRDRAILETFYATGIRRMELGRLSIPDLDVVNGVLHVRGGKGGKDRRVPIAGRACEWVDRYVRGVRRLILGPDSGDTLFLSMKGNPLNPGQLSRLGRQYIHRSGVNKPGACHLWRHSVATLMLENGAGLRQIQEMLGHASISTTQTYTHVAIKRLREEYSKCHPAARRDTTTGVAYQRGESNLRLRASAQ